MTTQSRGWSRSFLLATVLLVGAWVGNAAAQIFNQPPQVQLTAGAAMIPMGGSTGLTVTAMDPDGSIAVVRVYDGATLIGQSTTVPYNLTFTSSVNGPHSLTAVAVDNRLSQATSKVVTVTVGAGGNAPPTVSLSANPTSFLVGRSTKLTANPADSDGTIARVVFYSGGTTQIGQVTSAPWQIDFTPPNVGNHVLTAVAFDNYGAQTTSSAVTVTANNGTLGGGNSAPSVTLGTNSSSLAVGGQATLTASATDADGMITKVEFLGGPLGSSVVSTDSSSPYTYVFTATANGTFNFSARAYDDRGATGNSNTITITVSAGGGGGPPPTTLPRITLSMTNSLVSPGAVITLSGTAAATAAGATVAGVRFYQNGTLLADDTTSPYSTQVTLPTVGTHLFHAEVRDTLGNTNRTLNQKIIVQNAPAVVTTSADVYRLLNQATFGFSQAEAARVNALGIAGWINDQMNRPASGYPDSKYNRIQLNTSADCTTNAGGVNYPADSPQALCARDHLTLAMVQRDFFTNALYAPDQLRQRVAFALSQILVTSANEPDLAYAHVMSRYQNLMFQHAFGNYEALLRDVTYIPSMGNYLDAVNNDRASGARVPNENYAREIMQLFSINLIELNPDGSQILDAQGIPVPTYGQTEIAEFARVFTGLTYPDPANPTATSRNARSNTRYYGVSRMVPYTSTATTGHDMNAKTLLNGTVLPAGQGAVQDIDAAVRNVFMHPNTGPYIGRQLIQRLVTGNPSPAYVARVSAAFANNGSGVRGDMAHVVRTILMDTEARGTGARAGDFGTLREPVLMMTSLLRGLDGHTDGNRLATATANLGQNPYFSPTVFNYFMPDAKVPGTTLTGPEFGIHTTVTAIGRANLIYALVAQGGYAPDPTIPDAVGTRVFLAPFEALADNPAAMVSLVNQRLAGGQFPAALEATVVTAVNAITISATPTAAERLARARMAVYLIASSYDYQVQR